jgi:hypothetical protein
LRIATAAMMAAFCACVAVIEYATDAAVDAK